MSCSHASSTTLLWVYGEAPEAHLDHISECAECQQVVAAEEQVAHAIAPVVGALAVPEPRPVVPRWAPVAGGLALAAAALMWVMVGPGMGRVDLNEPVAVAVAADSVQAPAAGDLDDRLADLDADLASLEWDLRSL